MKETPFQILSVREICGRKIEISEVMEVCQGGPEVGTLLIDGTSVQTGSRFGGPIVGDSASIYLPVYAKSFFQTGFQLAKIKLKTGEMEVISMMYPLVYVLGLENDKLRFATDIDGMNVKVLSL